MPHSTFRVLIVDDNPSIHDDIRKLLIEEGSHAELDSLMAQMLGEAPAKGTAEPKFEVESAYQGQEALARVQAAVAEGKPYALAFVDMRMPPGWDGLETIEHLWAVAPELQIVISTAFSDYTWSDIRGRLGQKDGLLILKKPFEAIEARQMAFALVEKWGLARQTIEQLESLAKSNERLTLEVERRRQAEASLIHDALHDSLTDLPNRALLDERIVHSLAVSKRNPQHCFAVLFIDMDDFKVVNDSLGHRCGDRLLVEVAQRLVNCVRDTDCASRNLMTTAGRLGGDEFVVLLDGLKAPGDAEHVAERVRIALAEPLVVEGHTLRPSVSIGIVHCSAESEGADSILRDADTALYAAKAAGKSCVVVFDQSMRSRAVRRLRLESELRDAIVNDQLFLQYQPIVDLHNGRTAGFEALVRWHHPVQGTVPPDEFIPLAEETGLILPLGEWVLRRACKQVVDWRTRLPMSSSLFVNVNFSIRQLMAPNFVEDVLRILAEAGLSREQINIELTESLMMQNVARADRVIQQLRENEMGLHLDDFGTGFSSLASLDRLPVSALKLDKGFLRNSKNEKANIATMRAAIDMAHAHGIKVVAEGLELPEHLALMRELGCDYGQGFYFSRPVDAALIERRLLSEADVRLTA